MPWPFISIIVPACNSESSISGCIESLLAQDYPKDRFEIIIVDNNSTDNTARIIKGYPVKYILENKIQTSYAARNTGVRSAKGEIVAFIDADCIACTGWLSKAAAGFNADDIGCVAGEVKGVEPQNYVEEFLCNRDVFSQEKSLATEPLSRVLIGNAFYRKAVFEKIGFFAENWVSGGDADFSWRMQLETKFKINFAPEACCLHKHRADVRSMFEQSKKWGIGDSLLRRKYPDRFTKVTLKIRAWTILRAIFILPKVLLSCCLGIEKLSFEKKENCLSSISSLGWEIGKIKGFFIAKKGN